MYDDMNANKDNIMFILFFKIIIKIESSNI